MTRDCIWCGRRLDPGDSWLLAEPGRDRGAGFCRLEHVVPWTIRGPRWEAGAPELPGQPVAPLVLVRRRGDRTIVEEFASVDALAAWARAGGPWAR